VLTINALTAPATFTLSAVDAAGAPDTMTITNSATGTAGNQPITFNAQAQAWATPTGGMVDGTNAFTVANGASVTLFDGIHAGKVFTAIAGVPTAAQRLLGQFQVLGTAALTLADLRTTINAVEADAVAGLTFFLTSPGVVGNTINLAVDAAKLVGANAGLATAANSTTYTVDATGQWSGTKAIVAPYATTGLPVQLNSGINAIVADVGDSIVLNDGVHPAITFTVVAGAPALGQVQAAFTTVQQAINFGAAVNAEAANLNITANVATGSSTVSLMNTKLGAVGNTVITLNFVADVNRTVVANATTVSNQTQTTALGAAPIPSLGAFAGGGDLHQDVVAGDFVVIGDGVSAPVVFTAIAGVPVAGSATFTVSALAGAAGTAASLQNLVNAINGYTSGGVTLKLVASLTAVHNQLSLVNTVPGEAGNFGMFTNNGDMSAAGMAGGVNGENIGAGATVTLKDGVTTKTLTAVPGAPGANQFQIGATTALTAANLVAAINAAGLTITATDQGTSGFDSADTIGLVNNTVGIAGNQAVVVIDNVNANLDSTNMVGGSTGVLTVTKAATITPGTGGGEEVVDLIGATFGGTLTVLGGMGNDQVLLSGVTVTGATRLALGGGNDVLDIDASRFNGTFLASSGKQSSVFAIDANATSAATGSIFTKATTFSAGGTDIITDTAFTHYTFPVGSTAKVTFQGVAKLGTLLNDLGTSLGVFTLGATTFKPVLTNVNGVLG